MNAQSTADEEVRGLPKLALGTMNFGKRTSAQDAKRIVSRALELGIVHFDTANLYGNGQSEIILGQLLRGRRESVQIATKVGAAPTSFGPEGLSPSRIHEAIHESLKRLGTDYVDLYYFHVPDRKTPLEESLAAIGDLMSQGKVLSWGISNYASWQILEVFHLCDAMAIPRPKVAQQLYNILIRQLDIEYFAFAKKYALRTSVYNPLAGGLLSGRHVPDGSTQKGSRFERNPLYVKRYFTPPMFAVLSELAKVAETEGVTLPVLSYAWLLQRPCVSSVLLGPSCPEHVDLAVEASGRILSADSLESIDAIYRAFQGTDAGYAR